MVRAPAVRRPSRALVVPAVALALVALVGCSSVGADRGAQPASSPTASPAPRPQFGRETGGTGDPGDADQEAPAGSGAHPGFAASLQDYVACMAEHGVTGYDQAKVDAGILDVSPVDVTDPAFVPADEACSPLIDAQTAG